MATFVLVPGACAGAWIWDRVVPLLEAAGHAAMPVTLTGLGELAHLATAEVDLETHVADVVAAIRGADLTGVVLVGHSYGGMVLPAVAERCAGRVVRLIWIDGLAPVDGEAVADLRPEFYAWMASAGGWLSAGLDEEGVRMADPDLGDADVAWIAAKTTPQPMATFQQPLRVRRPDARLPKTYLLCRRAWGDDPYTVDVARAVADPAWEVVELDAHHVAIVSQPALVVQQLLARA